MITPYPEQIEAVKAAIKATRGTIQACTGFGKSVTMALLVNALQVRTLIVVPNLNLKRQLQDSFMKFFGSLENITIENVASPSLAKDGNYDLLIIDESQHSSCATIRKLNKKMWSHVYYRFFLSGTPYRSNSSEQLLLEGITGDIIYSIPYRRARERGYVSSVEAYFFRLPLRTPTNPKSWPTVYSELVVNATQRNTVIASLIKSLNASGESTLCLLKEIKHGEILQEMTGAAFAHGENEETEQLLSWFADGKLKSLIATTGVAGEGSDTRACSWVIIAGGGKSKPQFVQQVGRGVRNFPGKESCKVILFRDESSPWLLDHFEHQLKFLREEFGIEAAELPLPEGVI